EPAWTELCQETAASFFVSFPWFRCCIAGCGADADPLVLVIRDGATVMGIVPLLQQKDTWRIFPVRTIAILENQDSPFVDIVARPVHRTAVAATLLTHLAQRPGWHVLSVGKIDRASSTHAMLDEMLGGQPHLRTVGARSPMLQLDGSWEQYWTAQSQRFKK